MAPQSVARGPPRSGDRAAAGMPERAKVYMGRQQPATGSHLPFGRHCSALRGRTIRVVAFRASHPAKPPPRQWRFVQRFPDSAL